jgi:hypothetical protein
MSGIRSTQDSLRCAGGGDRVHFGGGGKHGDFSGQTVGSHQAHPLILAAGSHSLQHSVDSQVLWQSADFLLSSPVLLSTTWHEKYRAIEVHCRPRPLLRTLLLLLR